MGTRVNYELVGPEGSVGIVLYANNSHGDVDPDRLFVDAVRSGLTVTQAVKALLSEHYPNHGGKHRQGDPVFTVDLEPGDREYVLRARPDAMLEGGWETCYFERVENDGTVNAIDPDTCEVVPTAPAR